MFRKLVGIGNEVLDHFADVGKTITMPKGAKNEVGSKVRQTIKDLGGTMPEDLPTPDKSVKKIESEMKKVLVKGKEN